MKEVRIAEQSLTIEAILGAKNKIAKNAEDEKKTAQAIAEGAELRRLGFFPEAAQHFSQVVCDWARGAGRRVWTHLVKFNGDTLALQLATALRQADAAKTAGSAIEPLQSIKGLRVSFGSKHLRMLDPTRFAVLDSVLSEELGYALNSNGYSLFIREMLRALAELQSIDVGFKMMSVAELERAVFVCVRKKH
jgi:hypothetical protein